MNYKPLLILLFYFLPNITYSQDNNSELLEPKLNKNTIYVTGGFIPLWGVANLNYERKIWDSKHRLIKTGWVRLAGGGYATWGEEGMDFVGKIVAHFHY